jgi:hypothetical protein
VSRERKRRKERNKGTKKQKIEENIQKIKKESTA